MQKRVVRKPRKRKPTNTNLFRNFRFKGKPSDTQVEPPQAKDTPELGHVRDYSIYDPEENTDGSCG